MDSSLFQVMKDYIIAVRSKLESIRITYEGKTDRLAQFLDSLLVSRDMIDYPDKSLFSLLILGTKDLSMLENISQIPLNNLISTPFKSFIKIRKQSENSIIRIHFNTLHKRFAESEDLIKTAIKSYNISVNVTIPPIIEIDDIYLFLNHIDEHLLMVDSRDLITLIEVIIPEKSGTTFHPLIKYIDIIPENKVQLPEGASNSSFNSHNILSVLNRCISLPYTYNIILLNSKDTDTINAFISLIKAYDNYFALSDYKRFPALRQIFHATEISLNNLIKNVEYLPFTPHELKLFINRFNLVFERIHPGQLARLFSFLIHFFTRQMDNVPNINKKVEVMLQKYTELFRLLPTRIIADSDTIKHKYNDIQTTISTRKLSRKEIFELIEEYLSYIFNFSDDYNSSRIQINTKLKIEQLEKDKKRYLQKHRPFLLFFLKRTYVNSSTEFNNYIDSFLRDLGLLTKAMFEHLDFSKINSFIEIMQRFSVDLTEFNKKFDFNEKIIRTLSESLAELNSVLLEEEQNHIE